MAPLRQCLVSLPAVIGGIDDSGKTGQLMAHVIARIGHDDPRYRRGALNALQGHPDTVKPLLMNAIRDAFQSDPDREVRLEAASTLVATADVDVCTWMMDVATGTSLANDIGTMMISRMDLDKIPLDLLLKMTLEKPVLMANVEAVLGLPEISGVEPNLVRLLLYCLDHSTLWESCVRQGFLAPVSDPEMRSLVQALLNWESKAEPEAWVEGSLQLGWDDEGVAVGLISLLKGRVRRWMIHPVRNLTWWADDIDEFVLESLGRVDVSLAVDFLLRETRSVSPFIRDLAFKNLQGRHDPRILVAAMDPPRRALPALNSDSAYSRIDAIVDRLFLTLAPNDRENGLMRMTELTRRLLRRKF